MTTLNQISTPCSTGLPDPTPDSEIVQRVLAGETALFELLIHRYSQRIYRTMRAILNTDDVDDAVQQAFISAYTHLGQFAGRASFATWLTSIAVNEARARLRPRHRAWTTELADDEVLESVRSEEQNAEERMIGRELQRAVDIGIDSLPETYRTVLQLRQIDGMSTAAVAARLGVSNDVVKTRLYRARRIVRDNLDEHLNEPRRPNGLVTARGRREQPAAPRPRLSGCP
jgi:RNA polymerase sigma-70 factor, ECF subfamily